MNWNQLYFLLPEGQDPVPSYAGVETQSLVNVFTFPFIPGVGVTLMGPKHYKVVDVHLDTISTTARIYLKAIPKT